MTSPLPAAVFKWSTPIPRDGYPRPSHPAPDLYRVADVAPLRAWFDGHGYGDVVLERASNVIRATLPKVPHSQRRDQLRALAHVLRVAGLHVDEHKESRVVGLWIVDPVPYGSRLPVEMCS